MEKDVKDILEEMYRKEKYDNFLDIAKRVDINTIIVYLDLRRRGYKCEIAENGLINVYGKGSKEIEYFCKIFSSNDKIKWKDLRKLVEHANKLGRMLILAIVDSEGDVVYYLIRVGRF